MITSLKVETNTKDSVYLIIQYNIHNKLKYVNFSCCLSARHTEETTNFQVSKGCRNYQTSLMSELKRMQVS